MRGVVVRINVFVIELDVGVAVVCVVPVVVVATVVVGVLVVDVVDEVDNGVVVFVYGCCRRGCCSCSSSH